MEKGTAMEKGTVLKQESPPFHRCHGRKSEEEVEDG